MPAAAPQHHSLPSWHSSYLNAWCDVHGLVTTPSTAHSPKFASVSILPWQIMVCTLRLYTSTIYIIITLSTAEFPTFADEILPLENTTVSQKLGLFAASFHCRRTAAARHLSSIVRKPNIFSRQPRLSSTFILGEFGSAACGSDFEQEAKSTFIGSSALSTTVYDLSLGVVTFYV